ncbi:MAG: 4Fe-4S dicluster domain-containing protein [Candidatus Electrothrix sp. AU1_5]|nr:4Fe-4S dicluster domain-containing protein [Candidatus Electrothrix gigas]MCI5180782.1 4Fe-4S dicluster domain-containing protein [Candidatus Electrothrix gigas]MCI5192917.1 4Fe-4S dicluster domain-containing protein [Candidatus Electrothrix gigas]
MARLTFILDTERCIECFACTVACAQAHDLPIETNRRRVVTLHEGVEGKETTHSVACMHCADAPCAHVCPEECFYIREDGVVLHDKSKCIGCKHCLHACPFGAPHFPEQGFSAGVMDKCTLCAGGPAPTNSEEERKLYGQNRIAEGKVPICAAVCATNALLVGDADEVYSIYKKRLDARTGMTSEA